MSDATPERFKDANVIDLSAGQQAGAGPEVVVALTQENFQQVMQMSLEVPIVVDLWADWSEPCKELTPTLIKLAREFNGSLLLATLDTEAEPQAAAPFQVQTLPTVVGVLKGQVIPLFTGAYPEAEVRKVFDQLLKVAAENGVSGKLPGGSDPEPAPEPPLHTEGFDAMEKGDLAAAKAAFTKQLNEAPADGVAKAALAQIALMERTGGMDPRAQIAQAGADASLEQHLAAADADMALGNPEAAFSRLLAVIRKSAGEEKDTARLRLLDYFLVVGDDDERVKKARRDLAAALF